MVFAGLFPVNASDYEMLRDALGKLQLNDAAFFYEPENSVALGFGFRCGFLGLLHMEIVQERLEREFNIDLITTAPSVHYRITTTANEVMEVDNPTKFPPPASIQKIEEPMLTAMIITSEESVGGVLQLCEEKRGVQKKFEYLSPTRIMLTYEMPLNEIVLDFYDRLKSVSRGYASLDYHLVRLSRIRSGEAGRAGRRRAGGRADRDLPPRPILRTRPRSGLAPAQIDSAPDVRNRHSGRHRQPRHRPRNHQRHSQKRDRQVLRRRHHAANANSSKSKKKAKSA